MKALKKLGRAIAAVALVSFAAPSQAQTSWSYTFGQLLSGSWNPSTSFATMSVSTNDNISFNFTLSALDSLQYVFGSSAFISKAVFNTVTNVTPTSITNIQTNGAVGNITLGNHAANVGSVTFDFFDCFGSGNNCNHGQSRLQSNETISWTVNFASPQSPLLGTPPVALHVQSIGADGQSAWYTPTTPIPEPETYAMLLAGLGLMGFVARRRRAGLAAA